MSDRKDYGPEFPPELIASMDVTCSEALRIAKEKLDRLGYKYSFADIGDAARQIMDALLSERDRSDGGV